MITPSIYLKREKTELLNQILKKTLMLLLIFVIAQTLVIKPVKAYDQIEPYEPQFIEKNEIPNTGIYQNPASKEYRCYLEAGHKYHIYLVGDWITNDTEKATDYDIEVRNPSNVQIMTNTEAAGLPEQVANDEKHQYFVPAQSGDYKFIIYNDPRDSAKGKADAAVFMIIEHLEMNTRYTKELIGKTRVGAEYLDDYKIGYEFNTSEHEFLLYIDVPDPVPTEGIRGLDMYEARIFPMGNPAANVGYTVQSIELPNGTLLQNDPEKSLRDKEGNIVTLETALNGEGLYGGYNLEIPGFSFPYMKISCESAGVDMRKKFTMPLVNGSGDNVFYYMALLAEYFEGDIEFYMKTDYSPVNLTFIDPPEVGYTNETTLIKVESESVTDVDAMWIEYTTDSWKNSKRIDLIEKPDYWLAALPSFNLHDDVEYRIHAMDEIDNTGLLEGSFIVMNKVEIDFGVSGTVIQGGQTVKITGAVTRPSINLKLNLEHGGNTDSFNVQTDGDGVFTYDYKPTKIGEHDVTISYAGDEDYHSAVSREKSFRVDKRKLVLISQIENNPVKVERPMIISGSVAPAVNGLEVEIIYVSPEESFIETVVTNRNGEFSHTITPEVVGYWDVLPQLKVSELFDASQGSLISFDVENLTPVDIVVYRAMAFTEPPLMYIPIGLGVVLFGVLLTRVGFVRRRLGWEDTDEEEEEAEEEESPKGATAYKRRSER